MVLNRFARTSLSFLLVIALFFSLALSASAADEAAASGLDIRLKAGSGSMTVNGKAVAVQAPFQQSGTTYVPLSVMTKGFGASLQLKDNKIITLKYLTHTVVLTIGSKTAWIDGKKATLAAAPVVVQGVTMVPIRVVEAFGGKVAVVAATKEIRITSATGAAAGTGGAGGIDTDAGKSRIGDSYFEWSMNYPTGLAQNFQSDNGDYLSFQDVKKEFYLSVGAEEAEEPMDAAEQLDYLKDNVLYDETVLDSKPVKRSGLTFQRVVAKSSETGFYYDYRGIQANGRFYTLSFGKKAKSVDELNASSSILDSFEVKFDASNKALKDLTKVKDGLVAFANDDYGLELKLSPDWVEDSDGDSSAYYYNETSDLSFYVYSAPSGDTAAAWSEKYTDKFKKFFAETSRTGPESSDIVWNGVPAKQVHYSYLTDTGWSEEYDIFAVRGSYKYMISLSFDKKDKAKGDEALQLVLDNMKVDFSQVERTIGELPDPIDSEKLEEVVAKKSKKYGYSVSIPKYWVGGEKDFEKESVTYSGVGLSFLIAVNPDTKLDLYPDLVQKQYTSSGVMELTDKKEIAVGAAKGYEMSFKIVAAKEGDGGLVKLYLLENGGNVYLVQWMVQNPNATEFNLKQLDDVMKSFKFTES